MRSRLLLPALVFCLGLGGLVVVPLPAAAPPNSTKTVAQLIEQLSSSDYDERESAFESLKAVGEPALADLRKATTSKDAEVKKRALELVVKIERRVEVMRILAPRRVHLISKGAVLNEVIAELRKQSGYNVVLHDPTGKLRDRKVTIDTGNVPFWNALDQLCAKANLIEGDPNAFPAVVPAPGGLLPISPPPPGRPAPRPAIKRLGGKAALAAPVAAAVPVAVAAPVAGPVAVKEIKKEAVKEVKKAAAARIAIAVAVKPALPAAVPPAPALPIIVPAVPPPPPIGGFPGGMPAPGGFVPGGGFGPGGAFVPGGRVFVPVAPGQITLLDGKLAAAPTDARTAFRIRALNNRMFGASPAGQTVLTLQISPEPKIQWQRLLDVRVSKAIDDKGQSLEPPMAAASGLSSTVAAVPGMAGGPPGMVVWSARSPYSPYGMGNALHQHAALRLTRGKVAAKVLKEVTGTVTAEVLSEPEALLVADNVLKAKGKTFTGKQGGKFKVLEVESRPGGQVIINFDFEQVPGTIADNFQMNVPFAVPAAPAVMPAPGGRIRGGLVPAGGGAVAGGAMVAKIVVLPGGPAAMTYSQPNYHGISLRDDKGNILPASVNMVYRRAVGPGGINRPDYQFVYTPQKGHGKVSKMVFSGRRNVAISIPFTLENVPMP